MQIKPLVRLINAGFFPASPEWQTIQSHITQAIATVVWPPGSTGFTLYPERHGNGVTPIKVECMRHLQSLGWQLETPVDIATQERPGPMDATYPVGDRLFCVEWETGNISSSHRAVNKMALGIVKKVLVGGALILPTGPMAYYLTQRIGNLPELSPYFPLWRSLAVDEGLLAVIPIEHDGTSFDVPLIPKGTEGRARR